MPLNLRINKKMLQLASLVSVIWQKAYLLYGTKITVNIQANGIVIRIYLNRECLFLGKLYKNLI